MRRTLPSRELLQRIEANSQYTFAYIDADINPDKRVSVKAVNRSIASIVAEVLPNVNMEVKGLKIVLTAKRGESQIRPAADAGRSVKGRVTDESGAPVIGATVILKGTTTGTATNAAGEYAIDIRQADAVLVFSLIGYNKVEVALSEGQTQADVTLKSEAIAMDNVVVVGYGVQNKRDVTTAISSIKAEDFAAMPTADFRDAMAAKMPGVQVLTLGGQPDGNVSIRIRGIQSATSGNDPLYVIDGVPCDARAFSNLESSDIESLEVLKDASAAAIYGSRGSCGVILITTKRGEGERPVVSYDGQFSVSNVSKTIDMLDAYEFARIFKGGPRRRLPVQRPDGFDRRPLRGPSPDLPPRRPAHHGLLAGQDRHDDRHRLAGRHLPHGLFDQALRIGLGPHQDAGLLHRRQLPLPRRNDHRLGFRTIQPAGQHRRQAQPAEIRRQLLALLFEDQLYLLRHAVRQRRRDRLGADGAPRSSRSTTPTAPTTGT